MAPIGLEGSNERKRSDDVLDFIVAPAARELNLQAVRGDRLGTPGQISLQTIDHTARRPVVLIAEEGTKLPFDIFQMRTIFFNRSDLGSAGRCRQQIVEHLRHALDSDSADSPIATSMDVRVLQTGGTLERNMAELIGSVDELSQVQRRILEQLDRERSGGPVSRPEGPEAELQRAQELVEQLRSSPIGVELLADLIRAAGTLNSDVVPLLQRLIGRESQRLTKFVRQVAGGNEITYDGEDREWLLGLTEQATASIEAISLSTVDAGMRGFDGGLWATDLGNRYTDLQREAVARGVSIRRIFVIEQRDLVMDENFRRIAQLHRDIGIEVRLLDSQMIPEWLRSMIFDFIIFDTAVTYEMTPASSLGVGGHVAVVRTLLAPIPSRIRDLNQMFLQLWAAADPDRR